MDILAFLHQPRQLRVSADFEVCAMPARFYRLVVRSSRASICLTTGSGERMKNLVQQIGEAISSGMLSIEPVPQSEVAHV